MENTDSKTVKSKRDLALERLRNKYPDKDFADDESMYGQMLDDYDGYDNDISGYKEREGAFSDMFSKDPRSANFLMNWKNGGDPTIELVRLYGTDIKDALDDPEKLDAISKANEEFVTKISKEKELDEEYKKNLDESLSVLEKMQAEQGLTDDQIDDAMELLVTIVRDGIMGKFTPENINIAMKAITHDQDVANAGYEGEVRGKNTKIEEKLRRKSKNDGTAQLDGQNSSAGAGRRMPNLGALERFDDGNKNIWERGGEKRNKVNI